MHVTTKPGLEDILHGGSSAPLSATATPQCQTDGVVNTSQPQHSMRGCKTCRASACGARTGVSIPEAFLGSTYSYAFLRHVVRGD